MIRIGPAGWAYKDWEGIVYPPDKPKGFEPVRFLAQYFDTIEINSSFYGPPRPNVAKSWAERVAKHPTFKFTAKLYKVFTLSGKDVMHEPLMRRRELLEEKILPKLTEPIRLSPELDAPVVVAHAHLVHRGFGLGFDRAAICKVEQTVLLSAGSKGDIRYENTRSSASINFGNRLGPGAQNRHSLSQVRSG